MTRIPLLTMLLVFGACSPFDAASKGPSPTTAPDAGADASGGGGGEQDGGASSFCTQHPSKVFCADFDEGGARPFGFSTFLTNTPDVGSVELDDRDAISRPSAARFRLPAGVHLQRAELVKDGIAAPSKLKLSFDVRLGALERLSTFDTNIPVAYIHLEANEQDCGFSIFAGGPTLGIFQEADRSGQTGKTTDGTGGALPMGTWGHVEVILDRARSRLAMRLDVAEKTMAVPETPFAYPCHPSSTVAVAVGPHYVTSQRATDEIEVRIDNVLVEVE